MNAIQDQEDTICKMVRKISSELKNEVAKQVREFEEKHQESKTLAANKKKKSNLVIQKNKSASETNDAKRILTYQSKNETLEQRLERLRIQIQHPTLSEGTIKRKLLQDPLQRLNDLAEERKPGKQKLMSSSIVISTIPIHGKNVIF